MAPQRQEGPPARASSQWVRCPWGPRAHAGSSTQLDLLAGHRHGRGGGAERPKAQLADAALAAPGPARPPPGVGAQPGLCSLRPPHASPSGRVRAVTKRARPGPGCRDPRARDTRATCLAWPPGRARRRGCRAGPGPQRPGCSGWQSPSLEQRPTRAWPLRKAPRNPVFHCAGSSRPQQVPWPAPPPAAGRPPLLGHLGSEMLPPRAHHPDPRPVAHWPPATSLSKEPFE